MSAVARWFRLTPGVCWWCGLFLLLMGSNWRQVLVNADGDAAWHWRLGEWMLEQRAWIRADAFSHTRAGEAYVSKDWLSEVCIAAAGRWGGWTGIALLAAGVIAGIYSGLWRALVRRGADTVWTALVVGLAVWCSSVHWIARPHLATHALTAVAAWQLYRFHRDRGCNRQLAIWLIALAVVWPNVHGAFLNLFILLGIYLLATGIDWWRQPGARADHAARLRVLGGITVACMVASLLNPYGWRLHLHILEFLRTSEVAWFTREWQSPNFHSAGMQGWLAMVGALVMLTVVARPRYSVAEHLMIVVWGFLALYAVRNVPVFALVVAPIMVEHGSRWWRERGPTAGATVWERIHRRWQAAEQAGHGAGWAVATVVVFVCLAGAGPDLVRNRLATFPMPDRYPVAAVEFLRTNPGAVQGRMFNAYGWGGYLIWALPEHAVFVDGRNDFYGADLLNDYRVLDRAQPGWEQVLARHQVQWTILPRDHPLNALFELAPDWNEVYRDDTTCIYRMASGSI